MIEYHIAKSSVFWDTVMLPSLQDMNIGLWYEQHPGINENVFTINVDKCIIFDSDSCLDEQDLSLSLHGCRADMLLDVFTTRQAQEKPKVTKIVIYDGIYDFYNWGNNTSTNWEGLISRVQTCYGTSGNDKGNIFMAYYNLTSQVVLYEPTEYDNYDYIRLNWLIMWPYPH